MKDTCWQWKKIIFVLFCKIVCTTTYSSNFFLLLFSHLLFRLAAPTAPNPRASARGRWTCDVCARNLFKSSYVVRVSQFASEQLCVAFSDYAYVPINAILKNSQQLMISVWLIEFKFCAQCWVEPTALQSHSLYQIWLWHVV